MSDVVNIGFLGLGQMGGAIAQRLLRKDWQLHVYDPRPDAMAAFVAAGATAHGSPASVADAATVVFSCLPSQDVSLAVAFGPNGIVYGKAIRVYAEMSTIGGQTLERIASKLSANGIETIDAPVTGGPPAARAGTLTIMLSGEAAALATVQPILAMMGKNVIHVGGRSGMAQTMKVINNLIMAANMVTACEGLAMGVKAGLDVDTMLDVLRAGTGQSFAGCEILRRAVADSFDFGAKLSIVSKDMALGVHESAALQTTTPVLDLAGAIWIEAGKTDLHDEDFTAIMKFVESCSGVVVRARE
jgi:3-hydroxyisobutyrate dehydrogenase-like beta-hydroxyacid dehydrogenase